mmetsp:Transcript_71302/g.206805  ORF Transcript_71302/g.206805 Transcript_71302/m.206805 type:complete len:204 (+) Transcript_71302:338-949(+)
MCLRSIAFKAYVLPEPLWVTLETVPHAPLPSSAAFSKSCQDALCKCRRSATCDGDDGNGCASPCAVESGAIGKATQPTPMAMSQWASDTTCCVSSPVLPSSEDDGGRRESAREANRAAPRRLEEACWASRRSDAARRQVCRCPACHARTQQASPQNLAPQRHAKAGAGPVSARGHNALAQRIGRNPSERHHSPHAETPRTLVH